ncbi:hypothetical protein DEFR109230_07955 [Deinococcus frigens]
MCGRRISAQSNRYLKKELQKNGAFTKFRCLGRKGKYSSHFVRKMRCFIELSKEG